MKTISEDDRVKILEIINDPETDSSYMAFKKAMTDSDNKKDESK